MWRLNQTITVGSIALQALVVAALWGHWRALAVSMGVFVAIVPFNLWVTAKVLPSWGALRGELFRAVVNTVVTVTVYRVTGWPFPVWLWLPFNALIFEGKRWLTWVILSITCISNITFGLIDGVSWIVPAAFTVFAVFGRVMSDERMRVIRDMFDASEAQARALERVEVELRHAQKLEAVGRLAAGVAHEINTPLQFISDNVHFINEGVAELLELIHPDAKTADAKAVDYLREHLPEALRSTNDGLARVTSIVASLRAFAHPSTARGVIAPNDAVSAAIVLSKHEYRYIADVDTQLGDVPSVRANAGEVSQVLVNLIVNATHAIADKKKSTGDRGHISVTTAIDRDTVAISVGDDGVGIDAAIGDKIFDPFFTTKPVGLGTGQGLAIAHAIVARHGGTLTFTSKRGVGTTFVVRLPIATPDLKSAA